MHVGPPSLPGCASSAAAVSPQLAGALCSLLLTTSAVVAPPPALAAMDGAAIGKCLIAKCPGKLARCVSDPTCAANLLCIQTCTGRSDEADCQIKCGDEFSNDVVSEFTKCAVSDKNCVPQRGDDGSWPVPKDEALVSRFKPEQLQGNWYISAGLNRAFDNFDCQLHKFEVPADNKLVGNLQWRIKDPVAGTNFVSRYTVQEFVQDATRPGILYNHDNDFLHYQDDWYVLAQKDEAYAVVYYRGSNDAWDGYGGCVIYSREPDLPKQYVPEIDASLRKVGLKFADFALNDNSCRAAETKLEEASADVQFVEARVARGFTMLEKELEKDVVGLEKEIVKDVVGLEKELVKDAVGLEKEIEKDAVGIENELVGDFKKLFGFGK